MIKCKIYICS